MRYQRGLSLVGFEEILRYTQNDRRSDVGIQRSEETIGYLFIDSQCSNWLKISVKLNYIFIQL